MLVEAKLPRSVQQDILDAFQRFFGGPTDYMALIEIKLVIIEVLVDAAIEAEIDFIPVVEVTAEGDRVTVKILKEE
jgi:hypothetical protein